MTRPTNKRIIKSEQVIQWVGNQGRGYETREQFFISLILDIDNGDYTAEELNCDINDRTYFPFLNGRVK